MQVFNRPSNFKDALKASAAKKAKTLQAKWDEINAGNKAQQDKNRGVTPTLLTHPTVPVNQAAQAAVTAANYNAQQQRDYQALLDQRARQAQLTPEQQAQDLQRIQASLQPTPADAAGWAALNKARVEQNALNDPMQLNNPARAALVKQVVERNMSPTPITKPVAPIVSADNSKQLQFQRLAQLKRSIGI